MPLGAVTSYFFHTTAVLVGWDDEVPGIQGLSTFRRYKPDELEGIPYANAYLTLWSSLRLTPCVLVLIVAWSASIVVPRWTGLQLGNNAGYGVALVAIGAVMVASTCLLGTLLQRYTLPMWELVWLALLLQIGSTADALLRARD
jgi:hypothetical protein